MVSADVEKRLWSAADQLWANTGLKHAQFSTPVLGLIFLRYAEKRFAEAEQRIGPVGSGNRRKVSKADYDAEGVIFLRPEARFSHLQQLTESADIGNLRAQRDMLLPKLISGEIDVSGAEAVLEAAE